MAKLLNNMNKLIKKKRVKKKYTSGFQQPVEVNVPQFLQRSLLPLYSFPKSSLGIVNKCLVTKEDFCNQMLGIT